MTGRWYEAVGGLALEVQREGSESWQFAGCIQKKRGSFDIHANPYQDHGFKLSSHSTLDEAKEALLRRYVAETVADTLDVAPTPLEVRE